jgi:NCS2 family nucleobase:cation symporter-2/xanthine permease XanP
VPEGTPWAAAPAAAGATLVTLVVLALRAPVAWRLWAPLIGIAVGCAVAALFGLYDINPVIEAPWIGLPDSAWPGLDLTLSAAFWTLLPAFVVVTLVGAIETIGDGVAIQRVSRRRPRATDFRLVQGALNADGIGNLLSGLAGTPPNTTYSTSISLAELTGVAARRVGVYIGAIFAVLALSPKVTALLIAIPNPVGAAYVTLLIGLLFVQGMKLVVEDGLDHRKAAVVGLSFWIGVGFQNQVIFADLLGGTWGVLLGNGMTAGGLAAILLTAFMELTAPRRRRLEIELVIAALPRIDAFLRAFAAKIGWNDPATERLCAAGEETLAILIQQAEDGVGDNGRRLIITARFAEGAAELEFLAAAAGENLEDRLAYLSEQPELVDEREISFRLLRHYASSVRHQKYHDLDIVAVQVEGAP